MRPSPDAHKRGRSASQGWTEADRQRPALSLPEVCWLQQSHLDETAHLLAKEEDAK